MRLFLLLPSIVGLWAAPVQAERLDILIDERARDAFAAEMPQNAEFAITFADPQPEDAIMLSDYWMDKATGQFLANAVTSDGQVFRVGGLAILMVNVPVPTRRLLPDAIVGADDLGTIQLPFSRIGAFAVTSTEALVGMQVRRVLSPGRPVVTQSIMQPLVITKGNRVTIKFDDGLLSLTAPGRALDDAHTGQTLRIVNLVSNTVLVGTASPDGNVEVIR